MTSREEQIRGLVCEEAADWFVAHREGLTREQHAEFARWLRQSPEHVEEYLGIALTARDLRRSLSAAAANQDRAVNSPRARPQRYLPRWRYAWAAAAGVVLAVGLWTYQRAVRAPVPAPMAFETRHGEQLSERLVDGSVIHLNTDTTVTVEYRASARSVELRAGQSMFEVAHDSRRPFTVRARSLAITAIGTAFDVYLRKDSVVVTVVTGRVSIVSQAPEEASEGARPEPVTLNAGEQLQFSPGNWPGLHRFIDAQATTAWLHRRIAFANEPLGELAVEFNRYSATPIVIEDPALRALPVSGTFAADDTPAFVAFLRSLEGVRVEVDTARIRVWHR